MLEALQKTSASTRALIRCVIRRVIHPCCAAARMVAVVLEPAVVCRRFINSPVFTDALCQCGCPRGFGVRETLESKRSVLDLVREDAAAFNVVWGVRISKPSKGITPRFGLWSGAWSSPFSGWIDPSSAGTPTSQGGHLRTRACPSFTR